MQSSSQQPSQKQQHTSSRMLQSLLHTYTQNQNNQQSLIGQSQATVHDIHQYEEAMSYRSTASQKQESRLIELIEKKESQLKNLESFLMKEFQQISEHKERQVRMRGEMENVLQMVVSVKEEIQTYRKVSNQLQQMKHFVTSQVSQLVHTFTVHSSRINHSHFNQISQLNSIISSQQQQLTHLKTLTSHQSRQITKLTQQLTLNNNNNPMTSSSQPFKLQEQHLSKAIQKKQSKGQLSQEELQVSFSADKNTKAKQLINAIFHLRSDQSLLEGRETNEIRNSNRTVSEEHEKQLLGEQQRTLTGGFNHILLMKGSASFHSQSSHNDNSNDLQPQQGNSPAQQRSQCIQTSQVRRISSHTNNANNDASSAINKLDVFSQLNAGGDNFQDDEMSYCNGVKNQREDDQNLSEMEFRNMRKAKISRSMKAARNPVFGAVDGAVEEDGERLKEIRLMDIRNTTENITHPQQKILDRSQSFNTPPQPQKAPTHTNNQTTNQQSFHKHPSIQSIPSDTKQQNSPKDSLESPNTKKKKAHRYDYCRLYQEQEIKEIQNINTMCNHLMAKDRTSASFGSGNALEFMSFENVCKQLTPTKKSRQISPRKSSFSKLQPSKFEYEYIHDRQTPTKIFVRSGNQVPSYSNSKKSLTIQIPASPQRMQQTVEKNLSNPYLKLQNHLHQISCQEFSPKKTSYQNQRSNSGYLDRSESRSRVSSSDLRSREDFSRGQYVQMPYQHQLQQKTPSKAQESHIISNNMDRKQYIKSKIQMMKKKNSSQNNQNSSYPSSKSPQKISFLKSQQPQNHLSKQQLQRPNISRQVARHNRYTHEQDQPIRGYDFSEDKFQKGMMQKSRRTDRIQLQNSALTKNMEVKSKDASRVSYANSTNSNNIGYSKIEKIQKLGTLSSKENLQKSSLNVTVTQEDRYNDIYQQLNQNLSQKNDQLSQNKNLSIQSSVQKKTLNRPTQPTRQSVSPLRPTSKNTNNMYLPNNENNKSSSKKSISMMENQHLEERYREENLYKHPYMMDNRRRASEVRVNKYEDSNGVFENVQMFKRF